MGLWPRTKPAILDGSTGKPIDTGFARSVSNWKHGVRYGSPMYFRRRVFFVTRHATRGTESPGETKRGYVWGQRFDSEDEAFAKFAEYVRDGRVERAGHGAEVLRRPRGTSGTNEGVGARGDQRLIDAQAASPAPRRARVWRQCRY